MEKMLVYSMYLSSYRENETPLEKRKHSLKEINNDYELLEKYLESKDFNSLEYEDKLITSAIKLKKYSKDKSAVTIAKEILAKLIEVE